MKLTNIVLHPEGVVGSSLDCDLSFRDPQRGNPFNVVAIFGLDADEITPRYYGVSGNQNTKYYNLMLEKREIVLRIQLNPEFAVNQSYSDLRDQMYRTISATRSGTIDVQFKNVNNVVASTRGFIKKFEAPTSTKQPEIQITIECEDPMLKSPIATTVDITGFDPGFTILEDNVSTAPHGFKFVMDFTGALDTFLIKDKAEANWKFTIRFFGGFFPGDVLFFSSEVNNKYLYLQRSEQIIHLADALDITSIWPIMFPGENILRINNASLMNWRSIEYHHTYWGV